MRRSLCSCVSCLIEKSLRECDSHSSIGRRVSHIVHGVWKEMAFLSVYHCAWQSDRGPLFLDPLAVQCIIQAKLKGLPLQVIGESHITTRYTSLLPFAKRQDTLIRREDLAAYLDTVGQPVLAGAKSCYPSNHRGSAGHPPDIDFTFLSWLDWIVQQKNNATCDSSTVYDKMKYTALQQLISDKMGAAIVREYHWKTAHPPWTIPHRLTCCGWRKIFSRNSPCPVSA